MPAKLKIEIFGDIEGNIFSKHSLSNDIHADSFRYSKLLSETLFWFHSTNKYLTLIINIFENRNQSNSSIF